MQASSHAPATPMEIRAHECLHWFNFVQKTFCMTPFGRDKKTYRNVAGPKRSTVLPSVQMPIETPKQASSKGRFLRTMQKLHFRGLNYELSRRISPQTHEGETKKKAHSFIKAKFKFQTH